MRTGILCLGLLTILAGCGRIPPVLQPGDEVRPEIAVAPEDFWTPGEDAVIGMLLQVHRPGRANVAYLADPDVSPTVATMRARITFFRDGVPLPNPLEVPFIKDC